jgi:hypothetical protein
MAMRRLSYAAERTRAEDQIVDLMIAAEALFLEGGDDPYKSELRYRLSLRAAQFAPSERWGRHDIYRLFREAYDARSKVAHGGSVGSLSLPGKQEAMLSEFNTVVEEHLRAAVHKAVNQCVQTRRRFAVEWEAELLSPPVQDTHAQMDDSLDSSGS